MKPGTLSVDTNMVRAGTSTLTTTPRIACRSSARASAANVKPIKTSHEGTKTRSFISFSALPALSAQSDSLPIEFGVLLRELPDLDELVRRHAAEHLAVAGGRPPHLDRLNRGSAAEADVLLHR